MIEGKRVMVLFLVLGLMFGTCFGLIFSNEIMVFAGGVASGEIWQRIFGDTVTLNTSTDNVNIGENLTTGFKLKVNGTSYFNDTMQLSNHSLLWANLSTYAGSNLAWNPATWQLDSSGGGGAETDPWFNASAASTITSGLMATWNASGSGFVFANWFNQLLNTTNDTVFNRVTSTFAGDGGNLTNISYVHMHSFNYSGYNQNLNTTNDTIFNRVTSTFVGDGGNLTNISGNHNHLFNYTGYNQSLNTTNNVTFNNVTATNIKTRTVISDDNFTVKIPTTSQFFNVTMDNISIFRLNKPDGTNVYISTGTDDTDMHWSPFYGSATDIRIADVNGIRMDSSTGIILSPATNTQFVGSGTEIMYIDGTGLFPNTKHVGDIGSVDLPFYEMYASGFKVASEYTTLSPTESLNVVNNIKSHLVTDDATGTTTNEIDFTTLPLWLTDNENAYCMNKLQTIQNEALKYLSQKVTMLEQNNTILQNKVNSLEQRIRVIELRLGITPGP